MVEFVRGQTINIYCEISEDEIAHMEDITSIWFNIKQDGILKIDKKTDDCYIDGRRIYMRLSQAETLKFGAGNATIQLSVVLTNNNRKITKMEMCAIYEVQKEGIQNG